MNSDFSKSKMGDWTWTLNGGWRKIIRIINSLPLSISSGDYGIKEKVLTADKASSASLVPPFYAGLPPCDFKEGDRVVVWNNAGHDEERAYFSHIEENEDRKYHCFYLGDKWTSHGDITRGWRYCKAWEEENGRDDH
jgi:hypothetical protein